jgi:hypothetical protein
LFYNYLHIKPNGDVFYIGKGKGNRAWSKDRENTYWWRVVKKYGIKVKIIANWTDENKALNFEKFLIASSKNFNFKLTNLTDGGENPPSQKGKIRSLEMREKMRVHNRNKPVNKQNAFKSPIIATNTINKQKLILLGNVGIKQAGFNPGHVSACINGHRNTHKGHTFKRELQ